MTTPRPVLAADDATVGYLHRRSQVPILRDVTLALAPGQLVCLVGPNGAGKSTLLRTLVGAQPALAGTVRLAGQDVAEISPRERARHLSVVLTDRIDVGYLTVQALVGFGRTPHTGWFSSLTADDQAIVDDALVAAGAADLAHRLVHELSDGERQRVMIARALAQQPQVLVLDEPTAFLDVTRRVELVALLRRLTASTDLAVLMSTHELELAMHAADELWVIQPDGTYDVGGPEDLALDDRLGAAFAGHDVAFDHDRGSFVVHDLRIDAPTARVHGDARVCTWARRAVDRSGWRHVDHDPDADIELRNTGAGASWHCRTRDGDERGIGLASLVTHLRRSTAPCRPSPSRSTP